MPMLLTEIQSAIVSPIELNSAGFPAKDAPPPELHGGRKPRTGMPPSDDGGKAREMDDVESKNLLGSRVYAGGSLIKRAPQPLHAEAGAPAPPPRLSLHLPGFIPSPQPSPGVPAAGQAGAAGHNAAAAAATAAAPPSTSRAAALPVQSATAPSNHHRLAVRGPAVATVELTTAAVAPAAAAPAFVLAEPPRPGVITQPAATDRTAAVFAGLTCDGGGDSAWEQQRRGVGRLSRGTGFDLVAEQCAATHRRLLIDQDRCARLSRESGRRLERETKEARARAEAQMQRRSG